MEQLFAERRGVDGHWQKVSTSVRNEALDLMVMTHVMAHLHASRIDWRRPPVWAGEWHVNSMVRRPAATTTAPAPMVSRPPSPPAQCNALDSRQ